MPTPDPMRSPQVPQVPQVPDVIDAEFEEPELVDAELVEPELETGDSSTVRSQTLYPTPSKPHKTNTEKTSTVTPTPEKRVPSWRFLVPMLLQLGLILPVPLRNAYVAVAGETIVLETMAVDPYDIFRGYSQTLAYTISDADRFEGLPGYGIVEQLERRPEQEWVEAEEGSVDPASFYVLLEAPTGIFDPAAEVSPTIWKPVGIVRDRPDNLPANQVSLQATHNGNAILYNLERYYMPEDRREEINRTVQELQSSEVGEVKLEAKVDQFGKAIPVGLWLGDRRYQF